MEPPSAAATRSRHLRHFDASNVTPLDLDPTYGRYDLADPYLPPRARRGPPHSYHRACQRAHSRTNGLVSRADGSGGDVGSAAVDEFGRRCGDGMATADGEYRRLVRSAFALPDGEQGLARQRKDAHACRKSHLARQLRPPAHPRLFPNLPAADRERAAALCARAQRVGPPRGCGRRGPARVDERAARRLRNEPRARHVPGRDHPCRP